MEPRTVLKRLRGRAYFVYGDGRLSRRTNGENRPDLEVRPCSNGCALSSGGGNLAPSHSQSAPGPRLASFPIHAMRGRVNAPRCAKVQVAKKTWADGKQHGTKSRTAFLANWNRRRPWRNIARIFHVSWEAVPRAVDLLVARHRAAAGQVGMGALGVDETAYRSGYRDGSEDHWHGGRRDRPWEGGSAGARDWRAARSGSGVCERRACGGSMSARWQAHWNSVSRRTGRALRGAGAGANPRAWQLDETVGRERAGVARKRTRQDRKRTRQDRKPRLSLTRCRWRCAEKLTNKWKLKSADLLNPNLRTMQLDWRNEDFQPFRNGGSLRQAARFRWCQCRLTIYLRLAPTQRVTHTLGKHRPFRLYGCRCGWVRAAVRGVERQGETGSRKSVRVQIRRIPHNRLGSSLGQSTGIQTRTHPLLKIEFYQPKSNKESSS